MINNDLKKLQKEIEKLQIKADALDKIVRHLKEFKKTPEKGLAVFSGNISKVEGQSDLQLWSIEPIMPVKVRLYRCDKDFVLDTLK